MNFLIFIIFLSASFNFIFVFRIPTNVKTMLPILNLIRLKISRSVTIIKRKSIQQNVTDFCHMCMYVSKQVNDVTHVEIIQNSFPIHYSDIEK